MRGGERSVQFLRPWPSRPARKREVIDENVKAPQEIIDENVKAPLRITVIEPSQYMSSQTNI